MPTLQNLIIDRYAAKPMPTLIAPNDVSVSLPSIAAAMAAASRSFSWTPC